MIFFKLISQKQSAVGEKFLGGCVTEKSQNVGC